MCNMGTQKYHVGALITSGETRLKFWKSHSLPFILKPRTSASSLQEITDRTVLY